MSVSSGVSYVPNVAAYAVNNLDGTDPLYIGKAQFQGRWLIQKYEPSVGNMSYANDSTNPAHTNYEAAWSNRATLVYGAWQTLQNT